jgi:hypothetical protein
VRMIKILLEHGANPNIPQSSGMTTWQHALGHLLKEMTTEQRAHTEETFFVKSSPEPSLQCRMSSNRYICFAEITQAFLEHNADPGATTAGVTVNALIEKVLGQRDRGQANVLLRIWATSKENYKHEPDITFKHKGLEAVDIASEDTLRQSHTIGNFFKRLRGRKMNAT